MKREDIIKFLLSKQLFIQEGLKKIGQDTIMGRATEYELERYDFETLLFMKKIYDGLIKKIEENSL